MAEYELPTPKEKATLVITDHRTGERIKEVEIEKEELEQSTHKTHENGLFDVEVLDGHIR